MTKEETARQNFLNGYNCCQSVFVSFCDECGISRETALMLASPFGGGMGRLREVCGAVTAMGMVLGLTEGYTQPGDDAGKAALYCRVQQLAQRFCKETGSMICRELLGLPAGASDPVPEKRTVSYYEKRPCAGYIACAARLLEEALLSRQQGI